MKSRWTTYLLLTAVVAVWGIVVWKIFTPTSDNAPVTRKTAPAKDPTSSADTLQLDYPDPFLKNGVRQPIATTPKIVRGLPAAKTPFKRERVTIVHLATVASHGCSRYILTIGDDQHELIRGEAAGDFVLTDCDGDSLYLSKAGVTYGVKLCE